MMTQLHSTTVLAKTILLNRFGSDVQAYTNAYNSYRAVNSPSLDPVDSDTVLRYCNGGSGYENGPPEHFSNFNVQLISWII